MISSRHLLEWVHAKTFVHAGRVRQEAGDGRLEEETESQNVIPHALLEQRVAPSLTYEQIGPLYDDDRSEKGSVASVFELFASIVRL